MLAEYHYPLHAVAFRLPLVSLLALLVPRRARVNTAEGTQPSPASDAYGETRRKVEAALRARYLVLSSPKAKAPTKKSQRR